MPPASLHARATQGRCSSAVRGRLRSQAAAPSERLCGAQHAMIPQHLCQADDLLLVAVLVCRVTVNADAGDLVTPVAVAGAAGHHALADLGFPTRYTSPPPLAMSTKRGSYELPSKRGSMEVPSLKMIHSPTGMYKTSSINSASSMQHKVSGGLAVNQQPGPSLAQSQLHALPPIPASDQIMLTLRNLPHPVAPTAGAGSGSASAVQGQKGDATDVTQVTAPTSSATDCRSTAQSSQLQPPMQAPAWAPAGMRSFMELPIRRGGVGFSGVATPSMYTMSGTSTPATITGHGATTPVTRVGCGSALSVSYHMASSGHRPLGYLRLADVSDSRLCDPRVAGLLEAAALQLATPFEAGALPRVAGLVGAVAGAPNLQALVRVICEGLEGWLRARRQLRLQCRLVLLPAGGKEALMFEPRQPPQWSLLGNGVLPAAGGMVAMKSNDNLAHLANATGFKWVYLMYAVLRQNCAACCTA